MKIAFVGKGGSGKSTCAALFIHHLLRKKLAVIAVDADINTHLANLLGLKNSGIYNIPAVFWTYNACEKK